jgi:hypothetical protein
MAKTKWLSHYDNLTPEERMKKVAKILSEGVLSLIRKKTQNSREEDKKDIDIESHLCV